jgi:hypothetical protein
VNDKIHTLKDPKPSPKHIADELKDKTSQLPSALSNNPKLASVQGAIYLKLGISVDTEKNETLPKFAK